MGVQYVEYVGQSGKKRLKDVSSDQHCATFSADCDDSFTAKLEGEKIANHEGGEERRRGGGIIVSTGFLPAGR